MRQKLLTILTLGWLIACQAKKIDKGTTDIKKSECNISNQAAFNIDTIIYLQSIELKNKNIKANLHELVKQKIDLLKNARNNRKFLFPNTAVDSALYIGYESYDNKRLNFDLETRNPMFATILCKRKREAMINLVNNPGNFSYGECGTQIPEAQILFFNKGKKVASIVFSCGHAQITCQPFNMLTNFGGLNEKTGILRLDEIAPWK